VSISTFSDTLLPYSLQTTNLKIGIAVAAWNNHITDVLKTGAIATLKSEGIADRNIEILSVPGAFELPHGAQLLFSAGCAAVICLGCVIQGDTPHFDYVCSAATQGILKVGLQYSKPCIFGVITTHNEEQALERAGGKLGNKGSEAAKTALWMLAAATQITHTDI
jgi:6,7-dimethyl-8-ribityllumazine synthase